MNAMAGDDQRGALFRRFEPNQHSRVTYAELFFDLVFVFAVTQISHTFLGRLTPLGMLQTTLLSLGVWWLWVYTSWVTNWLNPAGSYSAVRLDAWRACAFNFDPEGF
jgi:low temperature requirement protein LtrA